MVRAMPRQPLPLNRPLAGLAPRERRVARRQGGARGGRCGAGAGGACRAAASNPDDPAMLSFAGLAHRALGDTLGALRPARARRRARARSRPDPPRAGRDADRRAPPRPRAGDARCTARCGARSAPAALLARAEALGRLGDQAGEVEVLEQAPATHPGSAAVRLRLGHALRALGDADAALGQYRAILAESSRPRRGVVEHRQSALDAVRRRRPGRDARRACRPRRLARRPGADPVRARPRRGSRRQRRSGVRALCRGQCPPPAPVAPRSRAVRGAPQGLGRACSPPTSSPAAPAMAAPRPRRSSSSGCTARARPWSSRCSAATPRSRAPPSFPTSTS